MSAVRSLIHTWLVLDFFGDARRRGGSGSSLTTTIFTQSFLALVFAALLYPETPPIPFAAANLTLSSLLVAVGLLGDEDRSNRRRADRALIGTSPMRAGAVVLARSGHRAFFLCLITTGMALPPAILFGFLRGSVPAAIGYVLLASVCAGLCAGTLAVTLRIAARWLGPGRAELLGGTLKALLLGGGLALFAVGLQNLRGTATDLPIGRLGAELLPSYHAARLLEYPLAEAWRLGAVLGAGALLLALACLLGEDEGARSAAARRTGPLHALLRRLATGGPRLGFAAFTATMMWRSPGFRSRVLPLLGLPAGMVYLSLRQGAGNEAFVLACVLLQLPAIYLPFLIAFLPRADQEGTRWVFDQAPPAAAGLVRDATWRALITHVLLPVHLLAAAILVPASGAAVDMILASLFSFALSVVVARPMCSALASPPFADDSGTEPATDLGALFPFAMALLALAIVYGALLGTASRAAAALAALATATWLLRRAPASVTAVPAASAPRAGDPEGRAEDGDEPSSAAAGGDDEAAEPALDTSLRRELRAVALLYVAVSAIPTLVGAAFAGPG